MNVLDVFQSISKTHFLNEFDSLYLEKKYFVEDIYKQIWKYISPELYYIFSSLQLKDIYVPIYRYEAEIEKNNKDKEKLIDDNKNNSSESQVSKNKKEIEKINNNIENLAKEMKNLKKNYENVIKFLEGKRNLLDDIPAQNKRDVSKYLVQYLLYPRLTFSKVEAVYSAKMLALLIGLRIQNLNVFDIMQKLIKFFLPCILCVTEFEAQNIGFFLNEFLKSIKGWQDEKVWEEVKIKIKFLIN
jgi:THO complex subunit 2